jgi:LuxR family maltose regulon positive regulatory protein
VARRSPPGPDPFHLRDLDLRPPALSEGLIERERLLGRLEASQDTPVIAVVAPAGYGKTVLLAQWMAATPSRAAWLTIESSDNDPVGLMNHLWAAFARADMIRPEVEDSPVAQTPAADGVRRLARALHPDQEPGLLFIDQLNSLRSRASWDVIAALIQLLQGRMQVVLASRTQPRLPVGEIRAGGHLAELSAEDLAFDESEASHLFQSLGVPSGYDLTQLLSRTEGWPVGLYLAALAMKAGSDSSPQQPVGGDDIYIVEYLRHVVLDRLPDGKRSFLIRTSILDRLCGPLCDAVLETTGSERVLESLENSNLLIMRLDRTREWHRYHQMFQEMLQAELRLTEPLSMPGLHARAAEWLEANGHPEQSIHHAQAAGDSERVARLIERIGRTTYATGRSDTLFSWLDWLEGQARSSDYPGAFAIGALAAALSGDILRGSRLIDRISDERHPLALMVRALRGRSGMEAMIADAQAARAGLPSGSEWIPGCMAIEGLGWLWLGEEDHADSLFAQSVTQSGPLMAVPTAVTALSERALIAMRARRWADAESHGREALRLVLDHGLDVHATSGLTFVVAARLARHQNDIARAHEMLARAARLRPQLNTSIPGESIHTGIEMARAHVELSEVAAARVILRETRVIMDQFPDLGILPTQFEEVDGSLAKVEPGILGPSTLTSAELRLLPMLASHLSFPEIGERLYISRHTVKTQAMSIYRKLGASSRSEAVQIAEEVGLLGV